MGDIALAKISSDNGPTKWNRTQHSTGPGPELRKYDDQLLPLLSAFSTCQHGWPTANCRIGWAGGACRVQCHKSD